jgi:hypothetical protein
VDDMKASQEIDVTKFSTIELADFATRNDTDDRLTIIAEIENPSYQPNKVASKQYSPEIPQKIKVPALIFDESLCDECMDKVEHDLENLHLDRLPVRLNSAHAFILNVTSSQLRLLSTFPLVNFIRPNRTHTIRHFA